MPFVSCPQLPILIDGTLHFEEGQLFLPLERDVLAPLRNELATDYPISGIYLGSEQVSVPIQSFTINSVSLAMLSVERTEDLIFWNVLSERHLDSGKES